MATAGQSRLFVRLAWATAFLTLGLIVFGAVVRVTDSGLGCGKSWPLCDGTVLPPLDNIVAWIEWLHRLFAALIGILGIAMLVLAWRRYRTRNPRVFGMTLTAAGLFFLQSALGAIVVVLELPPTFVTLHLGTAMLLFAALIVAGVWALYEAKMPAKAAWDQVSALIYVTAALALVIILTGALVRGSGATLACVDWPLCNGELWPGAQGRPAVIHMLHRLAVLTLGVSLVLLVWQVQRNRAQARLRALAWAALGLYALQAGIGAAFVLTYALPIWGALHVGTAAATWGALVILSAIEWLASAADGAWKA